MYFPSLSPCTTNPKKRQCFWICSCPQLPGIVMIIMLHHHTKVQPWEGKLFTRLTHNRQNCIVLGRLPSVLTKHWKAAPLVGWVTSNRVRETGKQFVWFGGLRLASILTLEGTAEKAHYLLLGILVGAGGIPCVSGLGHLCHQGWVLSCTLSAEGAGETL